MARLDTYRKYGAIPERRHDAFLLSLLLAVVLNAVFFAVQALLPRIAMALHALGGGDAPIRQEEERSFILVDPALLGEDLPPDAFDATSTINRRASQREETPDESPVPKEDLGVDEQLMLPKGTFGEIDPGVDSLGIPAADDIGDAASESAESADVTSDSAAPVQAELPLSDADEANEAPTEPPPEETHLPDMVEPLPEQLPEPVPEPIPEPIPEPLPEPIPEPAPEPMPAPEPVETYAPPPPLEDAPVAEPVPEPPPEVYEQYAETPVEMPPIEAPAEAEPTPAPLDLAMLPMSNQGLFDPQARGYEDLIRPMQPVPPSPPQYREREPQEPQLYQPQPQYQEPVRQAQPRSPDAPVRPERRQREGGRQAQFREIGRPDRAGGAPPRKSTSGRRVDMFDDPYMALLRDRYPEYMDKMLRQLQASLNRTMVLYPSYYATGQSGMFFSISPDGRISQYELLYPEEGVDDTLRAISYRTLLEAAPFDPPPRDMLADPAFKRMRLTINIY